jgi:hypothetical protein
MTHKNNPLFFSFIHRFSFLYIYKGDIALAERYYELIGTKIRALFRLGWSKDPDPSNGGEISPPFLREAFP